MIRQWLRDRLHARRVRQHAQLMRGLPFIPGLGMERRAAYAIAHGEPLGVTEGEWHALGRARLAGVAFDPFTWGMIGRYDGLSIRVDTVLAEDQERASREL